ncbi:MAG: saccharopine dehydrogenase NADP-binding domain-containing protein [Nanoarchaeota archaeon]|nr:saccharopine dehydrogenase NADP-binding domain-containing protein [Nanoarchaeota archaeon]MBU1269627.1 saccharopine dehydrogenase NADP-binding domain-containing protein [Nanoarchaeota archaeon]MBU1603809.1 saccharopine dehydrogenase NADP-binding domain-containing protein [Nanoarchaeota archaeon]MBU2443379.1 saccharopine dehydrogenase NADP-binding domain-containing protein [Nanoarchaeota archaeon]
MKVLLIGTGAVGCVLSKFLAKDKIISKIICASIDIKRAKKFIDTKNKKIKLVNLDASKKDQVIKAAKGVDVIINAGLPDFNENIMQAALKVKANYQDLCSHLKDLKTPEQLKYHEQFKKAKLTALINTGVAPGITNLLARDIADKLDSVNSIKIRILEEQKASEFIPSWSIQVTLDELSAPPLNYSNGKFRLLDPFEDFEEYEFPHPYGKRIAVNTYGDEISTLPKFIKAKNIDFKSSGTDIELSRVLYKMGLLSSKPIKFKNNKIVPLELFSQIAPKVPTPEEMKNLIKNKIIENSIFVSVVEGEGLKSGRKIRIKKTVIYPDLKQIQKVMPGATYISYPTGLAAYTFLKILPRIKEKGVFPPEALRPEIRKEVLLKLENNGIVVNEQSSKI